MTTTHEHTDVWVCTDCYFAHHYGYRQDGETFLVGPDFDPDKDVADREPGNLLAGLDTSDDTCSDHDFDGLPMPCQYCGSADAEDGIQTFSWSQCDGCGSHLGGSRYRLAVWQ